MKQARISASAMSEIKAAFKTYCDAVVKSELTLSSQGDYVDKAGGFIRWLEYEFEPGSRIAPYAPKKKDPPSAGQ
jgi:hypothetical protein